MGSVKTKGADGEHIDVIIGPHPESDLVFVVDQVRPSGRFDEHKVILGAINEREAREVYLSCYSPGWKGLGAITGMRMAAFKRWVEKGDTGKRIADQYGREGEAEGYAGGDPPDPEPTGGHSAGPPPTAAKPPKAQPPAPPPPGPPPVPTVAHPAQRQRMGEEPLPDPGWEPAGFRKIKLSAIAPAVRRLIDEDDPYSPPLDPSGDADAPLVNIVRGKEGGLNHHVVDGSHRLMGMIRWAEQNNIPLDEVEVEVGVVPTRELALTAERPDSDDPDALAEHERALDKLYGLIDKAHRSRKTQETYAAGEPPEPAPAPPAAGKPPAAQPPPKPAAPLAGPPAVPTVAHPAATPPATPARPRAAPAPVPLGWENISEGPWATEQQARDFLDAEVGAPGAKLLRRGPQSWAIIHPDLPAGAHPDPKWTAFHGQDDDRHPLRDTLSYVGHALSNDAHRSPEGSRQAAEDAARRLLEMSGRDDLGGGDLAEAVRLAEGHVGAATDAQREHWRTHLPNPREALDALRALHVDGDLAREVDLPPDTDPGVVADKRKEEGKPIGPHVQKAAGRLAGLIRAEAGALPRDPGSYSAAGGQELRYSLGRAKKAAKLLDRLGARGEPSAEDVNWVLAHADWAVEGLGNLLDDLGGDDRDLRQRLWPLHRLRDLMLEHYRDPENYSRRGGPAPPSQPEPGG